VRTVRANLGLLVNRRTLCLWPAAMACITLAACGPRSEQRAATITFGRALKTHGELLSEETTYVRTQITAMRALAMSLPSAQSAKLFQQGAFENIRTGLSEPRIQRMVQLGGAASDFGGSLARIADLSSSTADEKLFSTATRQLLLTAGGIGNLASGITIGAPTVNLLTFLFTEHYRLKYLEETLPAVEPAFRVADQDVSTEFNPGNSDSLLSLFSAATQQLADLLEASQWSTTATTAQDREIVANSYRAVARNRDHIKYVTGRQLELMNKGATAYDAVAAAYQDDPSRLDGVDTYSSAVLEVNLAFQSLK
jgi:hypothetical protein